MPNRLERVSQALREHGRDLLLVTPSADLRYLTGYQALPLERLTCLAINDSGRSWLIVPQLELPAAVAAGVAAHGIELMAWHETQDPYAMLAGAVGSAHHPVVNNTMWVEKAHHLQRALGSPVELANNILSDIRMVKSEQEVASLHEAGAAIDEVHRHMGKWLRALVGQSAKSVETLLTQSLQPVMSQWTLSLWLRVLMVQARIMKCPIALFMRANR